MAKNPKQPNTPNAFDRLRNAHNQFSGMNSNSPQANGNSLLNHINNLSNTGNNRSLHGTLHAMNGNNHTRPKQPQYSNRPSGNPYSIKNNRKGYGVESALKKGVTSGDVTKGVKEGLGGNYAGAAYHGAKFQHRLGKGLRNDERAIHRAHKKYKHNKPKEQKSTRQHPDLYNFMHDANGTDNPGMPNAHRNKGDVSNLPWHKSKNKGDVNKLPWHHDHSRDGNVNNLAWHPHQNTSAEPTSLSHQLASPQEQRDQDAEQRQKNRHPFKPISKGSLNASKYIAKSLKRAGKGAFLGAKGAKGKGKGKMAKQAVKGGVKSAPIWMKILGAMLGINILSRLALHTMMFLDNMFPWLNDFLPMIKGAFEGVKELGKDAFGLLGKGLGIAAKGLGGLAKGAGHLLGGLGHAVLHPFSAIGSGLSALHGIATGAMPLTGAGLTKCAMVGAIAIGGYIANQDAFLTRTADDIGCAVQQIKDDSGNIDLSGAGGAWTQKGTKAYNEAKATYIAAKAQGCDDKHAAAVTGNAAHESARFAYGLSVHQLGGGPGVGIFQFNDPPKDMSPSGQVKAILANAAPGSKAHWEHSSGSVTSLTNSFESIFERGGIPDDASRDGMAAKAYSMFNGMGKEADSASDNAGAAAGAAKGACSNASQDSAGGGQIIPFAKRYLGLPYSESVPERDEGAEDIAKGKPKSDCHDADCVSFVWGVFKHCGYKVTPQPWITTNLLKGQGNGTVQPISSSNARPGDAIVDHAHGAILLQPWHGRSTMIINEGGGKQDVNINTYSYSFYSVMSEPLHFGRPVK